MQHKDVIVLVNHHDDCGVPPGVPETCVDTEFLSHAEDTRSKPKGKGLLDGAIDPPSFSVGMVDPMHSSQDMPVNFDPVIDKERKFINN